MGDAGEKIKAKGLRDRKTLPPVIVVRVDILLRRDVIYIHNGTDSVDIAVVELFERRNVSRTDVLDERQTNSVEFFQDRFRGSKVRQGFTVSGPY